MTGQLEQSHVYQFGYSCDVPSIFMCTMTLNQILKRFTTQSTFEVVCITCTCCCPFCAAADLWKSLMTFAAETYTAYVLRSLQRLQEISSNMFSGRFSTQQMLQAMYDLACAVTLLSVGAKGSL